MSDIEIEVEVINHTPMAIQVENENTSRKPWIPKSVISDYTGKDKDNAESIFLPEYIAEEKGLK